MRDYVHEHFAKHPDEVVRPHIVTKRGGPLSVQASRMHYCSPREDGAERYTHVEVYCWTGGWPPKSLRPYSSGGIDPAAWVPVEVVNRLIAKWGGVE